MKELDHLQRHIDAEANEALEKGALVLAAFTWVSAAVVGVLSIYEEHMRLPSVFVAFSGGYLLMLWRIARKKRFRAAMGNAVTLAFLSVPVAFYAAAQLLTPSGAATYLFGPISATWFLMVILSGFLFDPSLARWMGLGGALAYVVSWLFARRQLDQMQFADPMMTAEMVSVQIHLLRAARIGAAGLTVGALANSARRLVARSVNEHVEREKLSQLFGEYVSDAVRDHLLKQLAEARGERARVAVLFSDLRGFTTLSEKLTPQELMERLNEYFDVMVAAIRKNGGRVDKFIGDAVMAVFGGLLPVENPSESAVAAAVDMRRALAELNARWTAQGRPTIDNGIGVHVGEVIQGPIGSKDRKEFGVIGDVVNTASRLESASKELGKPIVLSGTVHAELPEARKAQVVDLGEVKLKGKENAVKVWGIQA